MPKCEFGMQLCRVEEPENAHLGGVWMAAHPSLGEKLVESLLRKGLVRGLPLPDPEEENGGLLREVANVCGTDMRADFLLHGGAGASDGGAGGSKQAEQKTAAEKFVVEVKSVLDTDYDPATAPAEQGQEFGVFLAPPDQSGPNYRRAGIFPWGRSAQKGPAGEPVVSARAIKHVQELTRIARGEKKMTIQGEERRVRAAILFVVVRHDVETFRPNYEACPSFARYLKEAKDAGVLVVAHRVRWGEEEGEVGKAFSDGELPIVWPTEEQLSQVRRKFGAPRKVAAAGKKKEKEKKKAKAKGGKETKGKSASRSQTNANPSRKRKKEEDDEDPPKSRRKMTTEMAKKSMKMTRTTKVTKLTAGKMIKKMTEGKKVLHRELKKTKRKEPKKMKTKTSGARRPILVAVAMKKGMKAQK